MTHKTDVETYIIQYVQDHNPDPDVEINRTTNFVEQALLDSFEILNLIMTLESEFQIKFTPQELAQEEIRKIGPLCDLTFEKMAPSS